MQTDFLINFFFFSQIHGSLEGMMLWSFKLLKIASVLRVWVLKLHKM